MCCGGGIQFSALEDQGDGLVILSHAHPYHGALPKPLVDRFFLVFSPFRSGILDVVVFASIEGAFEMLLSALPVLLLLLAGMADALVSFPTNGSVFAPGTSIRIVWDSSVVASTCEVVACCCCSPSIPPAHSNRANAATNIYIGLYEGSNTSHVIYGNGGDIFFDMQPNTGYYYWTVSVVRSPCQFSADRPLGRSLPTCPHTRLDPTTKLLS